MSARTLAAWFKLANADAGREPAAGKWTAGVDVEQARNTDPYQPNAPAAGSWLGLFQHQTEIVGYGPNEEGRRFGIMLDGDRILAELCIPTTSGRWNRDTKWHHVAAVVPEQCTQMKQVLVYLDGEPLVTTSRRVADAGSATTAHWVTTDGSERFDTAGSPLKIGGIPTVDYAYAFNGSLREVRIYDRPLSPAEIAVLHGEPQKATSRGLVAGYHLDEGQEQPPMTTPDMAMTER